MSLSLASRRLLLALILAGAMGQVAACGDEFETTEPEPECPFDPAVPCNQDPWNCGAGQTCWFNQAGTGMECLNARNEFQAGDACTPSIGTPTCGEGLLCVGDMNGGGTCERYCDNTETCKACPEGLVCRSVSFSDQTTMQVIASANVCLP